MKILKQGIDPKTVSKEVTCYNCDTVYEVKRAEMKYNSDQRDGGYYSFDCEICGKQVTVNEALFEKHTSSNYYNDR